jgi:EAL domain-containing protein (putative c-di-GMP-specific phosphodiesterase class I)
MAEGVETSEQRALLRRVGVGCAQGDLVAPPMPVDEVVPWAGAWAEARMRDPAVHLLRHAGR